ncbi:hypothetical protein [Streptomyces sp. NPDC051286]|uniref:hypothetical protein n=1 Tax=Streptomyces sp. NPDC051286 TaxID=3365647 RepID=UPI0037AB7C85
MPPETAPPLSHPAPCAITFPPPPGAAPAPALRLAGLATVHAGLPLQALIDALADDYPLHAP